MSDKKNDKDWWEKLGEKGQASYLAEHPNSQKAIEARAKAENGALEAEVLNQEIENLKNERIGELYDEIGPAFICEKNDFIGNIKTLEDYFDSNVESIEQNGCELNITLENNEEYRVFANEEVAYVEATNSILNLIDDVGYTFIPYWRGFVDEDLFEKAYEESDECYIDDIRDESSDTHESRLAEEMAEANCETENEFKEHLMDRRGNLAEEYINDFGEDGFNAFVERFKAIDLCSLAEHCVDVDGIGHQLSSYDGKEHNFGDWVVIREN